MYKVMILSNYKFLNGRLDGTYGTVEAPPSAGKLRVHLDNDGRTTPYAVWIDIPREYVYEC
jgi:hypothetical protein